MENVFEDLKREYFNHFSNRRDSVFADSYDQFVDRLLTVIRTTLITTPEGHDLIDDARTYAEQNAWTQEQWAEFKPQLLVFLFHQILTTCPFLKSELARHLYDELRKEM